MREWVIAIGIPAELVDNQTEGFKLVNLADDIKRHDWEAAWMTYMRTEGLASVERLKARGAAIARAGRSSLSPKNGPRTGEKPSTNNGW